LSAGRLPLNVTFPVTVADVAWSTLKYEGGALGFEASAWAEVFGAGLEQLDASVRIASSRAKEEAGLEDLMLIGRRKSLRRRLTGKRLEEGDKIGTFLAR